MVITDDSPEPALILFMFEGGLVYLDKGVNGAFAAYEDGFSALELTRKYYREAGFLLATDPVGGGRPGVPDPRCSFTRRPCARECSAI